MFVRSIVVGSHHRAVGVSLSCLRQRSTTPAPSGTLTGPRRVPECHVLYCASRIAIQTSDRGAVGACVRILKIRLQWMLASVCAAGAIGHSL